MKGRTHDLRRFGRPARTATRVRRGCRARLHELWSVDDGAVHQPDHRKATADALQGSRERTNWRVFRDGRTREIVAVEPNNDYEHVFTGPGDLFMDALEYAAAQLRRGE